MEEGETFAQAMEARASVSQQEMSEYLAGLKTDNPQMADGPVSLLDSGAYAMAGEDEFREGDEWTVDAVLDTDVQAYAESLRKGDRAARGYVLPVPRRFASPILALRRMLQAPDSHYTEALGFMETEAPAA